jgi:hypothetical protein
MQATFISGIEDKIAKKLVCSFIKRNNLLHPLVANSFEVLAFFHTEGRSLEPALFVDKCSVIIIFLKAIKCSLLSA